MKIISYFILTLVIINLFFLVGCNPTEKSKPDTPPEIAPDEETGISEVFEDPEDVNPPQIPT